MNDRGSATGSPRAVARGRGAVVIAGGVARCPDRAGHAWAFLQYVLGFRRLGWDVLWLDSVDPGPDGSSPEERQIAWFRSLATRFGLERDAALLVGATSPRGAGPPVFGATRREVLERVRASDFLVNVMGYLRDEELLAAARRRVFLDIDPGFGQMWQDLGLARPFADHDAFATVGVRIGRDDCPIPTLGLPWIPTLPPVVLDRFPAEAPAGDAFTSLCTWRGPFAPVDHGGWRYGLRAHELRRFVDLPGRTGARFELALDIAAEDGADRSLLERAGWILRDPAAAGRDPEAYRRFIVESGAEIGVAKGMYVDTRCGWFSDRSVCYLATGRPVVAQETGWSEGLPAGRGLLAFTDLDGAVAAVEAVRAQSARHARAAREIAVRHFDSDIVLASLADRVGAGVSVGVAT